MQRRVLIDAGNTGLKWAAVEDGKWLAQGRCDYADWSALRAHLAPGSRCFIASVTTAANEARLAALLEAAAIDSVWLQAEHAFEDLRNSYLNPGQLGVDRWMGLIGARGRTRSPALVVSVGTAMTVDALSADGVFLGGVIVPGVTLMRQALLQGTAQVAAAAGQWQAFPRTTADAVHSGIVAALCGAILAQYSRLGEVAGTAPVCLLTGGDAETVLPRLGVPAELVPGLILEGINRVAVRGSAG